MDLPAGVAALKSDAEKLGYRVVREGGSGWPGYCVELHGREHSTVQKLRLGHDRGAWEVEVCLDGRWFDPREALLAIRNAPHEQRAMSHQERRDATVAFLREFDGSPTQYAAIRDRAAKLQAEYMARMSPPQ